MADIIEFPGGEYAASVEAAAEQAAALERERAAKERAYQARIQRLQKRLDDRALKQQARLSEAGMGAAGQLFGVAGQAATITANRPITGVSNASPKAGWMLGLSYFVANWKAPSLDDVMAYDHLVSIFGYNQAGRKINLSGSNIMPRKNFSYVRTSNAHINGPLGIYKEAIEAAFNNGIRFWDPSFAGKLGSFPDDTIKTNKPR